MLINISDKSRQVLGSSCITTILQVPKMTDAEYDEVKYIVEYIGGHWREKYKGFVFDDSLQAVRDRLNKIMSAKQFKLSDEVVFKIKNQFYPTPNWLAKQMVNIADIKSTDRVLEPSAGRGAILEYIAENTKHYHAVEFNRENAECLRASGYRVNLTSFEKYYTTVKNGFDKIVMNPPFSNKMDIKHTVLAYNLLNAGGRLVSLLSENSIYFDRTITHRFNNFLNTHNSIIREVPHGSFKDSGTNVDVVMVIIEKLAGDTVDITGWD